MPRPEHEHVAAVSETSEFHRGPSGDHDLLGGDTGWQLADGLVNGRPEQSITVRDAAGVWVARHTGKKVVALRRGNDVRPEHVHE